MGEMGPAVWSSGASGRRNEGVCGGGGEGAGEDQLRRGGEWGSGGGRGTRARLFVIPHSRGAAPLPSRCQPRCPGPAALL